MDKQIADCSAIKRNKFLVQQLRKIFFKKATHRSIYMEYTEHHRDSAGAKWVGLALGDSVRRGEPKGPRGKVSSSHALSVRTCREEHKKHHPGAQAPLGVSSEVLGGGDHVC